MEMDCIEQVKKGKKKGCPQGLLDGRFISVKEEMKGIDESFLLDPVQYTEKLLWIRSKKGNVIPFLLNSTQLYIEGQKQAVIAQGKKPHFLILKYRRGGVTTWEQAKSFQLCASYLGQYCLTLAHDSESTQKIFDIAQLYYDTIPEMYKPSRQSQNKRELAFDKLGSKFYIGTAGSEAFGRGQTLQRVHGSEVAFWPHEKGDDGKDRLTNLVAGLMEACSGEIVFESTPNGRQGFFYHEWQRAKDNDSTFTPIFIPWWTDVRNKVVIEKEEEIVYTEEEEVLVNKYGLVQSQIKFRRDKQKTLKGLFLQEYPENDVSCFVSSSHSFFDISAVLDKVQRCKEPVERRESGAILIWEKPEPGKRYVAGGDVGEGLQGRDFSGIGIIEKESGCQVASLHGIWRPEIFAKKAADLAMEYNKALLAIESNNHGHSALNTLLNQVRYPNLYYHENYDQSGSKKLGWQTNGKTRDNMLDNLKAGIEENCIGINDVEFLNECVDFIDNGSGKYEAASGKHDDRIIKWAIAWYVRNFPVRERKVGVWGN